MNRAELAKQLRAALKSYTYTATDEEAAKFPSVYDKWKPNETVSPGDRRYEEAVGILYKVREGKGHTTQADWPPHLTPDLWAPINETNAGTIDDPIPAVRGMEYVYGKYYLDPEDGLVYLCTRTGEAEGGTVVLQFLPHELIGNYFALAEQ